MTIMTKILKTYNHMKDRCYNPKNKSYSNYGGRGIYISNDWLNDKDKFIKWCFENGCNFGLAIDRINNNGPYSPENCRWVTPKENNQNRRSSKMFTINGITLNLQQWCDEYGISRSMVNARLSRGWDIEKALSTPKRVRNKTDMIGKRFGRLTVIEFYSVGHGRKSVYKCLCDCGNTTLVDKTKLTSGHTRSCGCIRQEMYESLKEKNRYLLSKEMLL